MKYGGNRAPLAIVILSTFGIIVFMKKVASEKVTIGDLAGTIDNLAIMVAKGFDSVEKKFDEVNNRIGKVEKEIGEVKNDIAEVKENLVATRRDVLEIGDRFVPRYEFHDLLICFDKLEQKVNTKK